MSSRLIFVLDGPNLNLPSERQPYIHRHETLVDVEQDCRAVAAEPGSEIRFHLSNRGYESIDWVHEAREAAGAIVFNAAAVTRYSVAVPDAPNAFDGPEMEGHISHVHKRDDPGSIPSCRRGRTA